MFLNWLYVYININYISCCLNILYYIVHGSSNKKDYLLVYAGTMSYFISYYELYDIYYMIYIYLVISYCILYWIIYNNKHTLQYLPICIIL